MSSATPFRDRIIPWYFVAFFLVVFTVDGIMATLAIRGNPGVVTDHAYEKGLAYNSAVRAQQQQEARGWKSEIALEGALLHVTLRDAAGAVLVPQQLTARFIRPTSTGMDFEVTMQQGKAMIDFPAPGLWEVRIHARVDGVAYQQSKRLVVP
jgi:nitrogen fixation protein FixH